MAWWKAAATHLWVFAVGRGNAAFVRSALNHGFLIDTGTEESFSPTDFVEHQLVPQLTKFKKRSIAQAVLSHPHSDHIAECGRLEEGALYPHFLTCPHDKPSEGGAVDPKAHLDDQNPVAQMRKAS